MSGQSSIPDSSAPVTAAIYERLGVPRRINAAGTLTRLGGSLMAPAVLLAMAQAAEASVDISELQSAASGVIARCTGAQAGIVTSGAAAGLTLATAACLAGWDVNRMAALPDTRAMPNRILMARTHRNSYDHAIRLAGATIVDIGHNDRGTGAGVRGLEPWEIEAAIDANTAAFLFVATSETLADLPAVAVGVEERLNGRADGVHLRRPQRHPQPRHGPQRADLDDRPEAALECELGPQRHVGGDRQNAQHDHDTAEPHDLQRVCPAPIPGDDTGQA